MVPFWEIKYAGVVANATGLSQIWTFFLLVGTSAHRTQSQRDNGSPLRMTMHLSSVFSSMLSVSNQETWFVILVLDQKF